MINLSGNYISDPGGNQLFADLTGNLAFPTIVFQNASTGSNSAARSVGMGINGKYHFQAFSNPGGINGVGHATDPVATGIWIYGTGLVTQTTTIPIVFKDPNINGDASTPAELTVTATAGDGNGAKIQLDSLSYNVPDQSSTLALLALGAGGVLALRQRRQAA